MAEVPGEEGTPTEECPPVSEEGAYERLNDQQRLFVDYYISVSNCSQTDAARRAGYHHPKEYGYYLYKQPTIRAAIKERLVSAAGEAEEFLWRVAQIARGQLGMLLKRVKDPTEGGLTAEEEERLQDAREIRRAVARENGEDEDEPEERFGGFLPGEHGIDLEEAERRGLLWMIEGLSYDKAGRPNIKIASPLRANELMLQRFGLLKNNVDLTSNGQTLGVIGYTITPPGAVTAEDGDGAGPGGDPKR